MPDPCASSGIWTAGYPAFNHAENPGVASGEPQGCVELELDERTHGRPREDEVDLSTLDKLLHVRIDGGETPAEAVTEDRLAPAAQGHEPNLRAKGGHGSQEGRPYQV